MYQLLQKGEWQIADTCPKLIEAIPTGMHDEKRPGDVLKGIRPDRSRIEAITTMP
jgi:hypothetical protein